MRVLMIVAGLLAAGAAHGQTQWVHERLHDDIYYMDVQKHDTSVNPSGIPVYAATTPRTGVVHAWCYKTDLNRVYFDGVSAGRYVVINDAGQTAFTALTPDSYHIIAGDHDYFKELFGKTTEGDLFTIAIDGSGTPSVVSCHLERSGCDAGLVVPRRRGRDRRHRSWRYRWGLGQLRRRHRVAE